MNSKYWMAAIVALLVGFMAASEAGQSGIGLVIRNLGPLAIIGLLVAGYYENKSKQ